MNNETKEKNIEKPWAKIYSASKETDFKWDINEILAREIVEWFWTEPKQKGKDHCYN